MSLLLSTNLVSLTSLLSSLVAAHRRSLVYFVHHRSMTSVSYSPAPVVSSAMDAQLGLDSPLSFIPPLSDTYSTPDSVELPELDWPFDVAPDPNELHDFIFSADDSFSFSFDGDSEQPTHTAQPIDERYTATDTAQLAGEEEEGGLYAPITRSSKAAAHKRVVCQSACVQCRRAKTRCDGQRPCVRCTTAGRADECMDRPAEEIERGRQNRKRKPKVQRNPAAHTTNSNTASPALSPVDPSWPSQSATPSLPLDSIAARLSFGQTAILRQSIIDRVNRLCASRAVDDSARCQFIRAVHLLLVKIADSISATHFDLFINGRLPGAESSGAATPLPSCLRVWSRVDTRPLYIDWTISPTECDADQTVDEVPTVRIRTGPAAQRAVERWESMQRLSEQQQQPTAEGEEDGAVQPIEQIFSCLGVADSVGESEPSSRVRAASSTPLHACWCPVFSGAPLPSASRSAHPTTTSNPALGDTLAPPAPLPCMCFAATALPTAMIVNAAWERLFGYSQAELRQQLMRRGCAVMMEWYVADSWWALHSLLASHALTDKRSGYRMRAFVVVRTRWGVELPCMLEKRIVESDGFSQAVSTITPLAQLTPQQMHTEQH